MDYWQNDDWEVKIKVLGETTVPLPQTMRFYMGLNSENLKYVHAVIGILGFIQDYNYRNMF